MKTLQSVFRKNRFIIWYAACFLLLGIIDQRRGSADGYVQMMFANLVGSAAFCMLLPSMKRTFFVSTPFKICAPVCVVLGTIACLVGKSIWLPWGQWNTAVLNCVWMAIVITYCIWDRKNVSVGRNKKGFLLLLLAIICLFMLLSLRREIWQISYFVLFGGLYVIGIPGERKNDFLKGMLIGLAGWFFLQQTVAYALRPYDYIRYRGMYTGETQNTLFYLICFCAFTGIWLSLKKERKSRLLRATVFLLSAFCLSLMLLTGGRSGFTGAALACLFAYIAYDIVVRKSFRHWILQGIVLFVCLILLFPVAYGTVRIFPTVLHHPIWFSDDYQGEERSVLSFDPADSDKYITFSEALEGSVGRILEMIGVHLSVDEEGTWHITTPFSIQSDAAEMGEPGSSIDNPYIPPDFKTETSMRSLNWRKIIYSYYLKHLNLSGHSIEQSGFWAENGKYLDHAHNIFLQVAYNYGILTGALFLIFQVWIFLRLIGRRDMPGIIGAMFLTAILVFGLGEMVITTGQISLSLLFVIYYWGINVPEKGQVTEAAE